FYGAGFADDVDLDGTRVLHSGLDLRRDVAGELDGAEVIDLTWLHKDADFAAGADGVGFFDSLEAVGDVFQFFHTLCKVFSADVAGAWTGCADGVDHTDDQSFGSRGFDIIMVLLGSQGDFFRS